MAVWVRYGCLGCGGIWGLECRQGFVKLSTLEACELEVAYARSPRCRFCARVQISPIPLSCAATTGTCT